MRARLDVCVRIVPVCGVRGCDVGARQGPAERHGCVEAVHGVAGGRRALVGSRLRRRWRVWAPSSACATPAKGTTCFRSFSIGNDLFTTLFTAQMGRGKIQLQAFTSNQSQVGYLEVCILALSSCTVNG